MPPVADSSAAAPYRVCLSPGPVLRLRQHFKVLENRDLCRIISSYIPTDKVDGKNILKKTCVNTHT